MGGNCSTDADTSATQPQPTQNKGGESAESQKMEPASVEDTPDPEAKSDGASSEKKTNCPRPTIHDKCRNDLYPRTDDVRRFAVPDESVSWDVEYPDYQPVEFFAVQEFPIPEDEDFRKVESDVSWNIETKKVNRASHQGEYQVVDKVPRNPVGRTGVCGRGRLARWGPNHAADPIVTRWKKDNDGQVVKDDNSGKNVLQFVAIVRGDSGEWAIPGGFVDPGEAVFTTLKREFAEEALASEHWSEQEEKRLADTLATGVEVYRGYVDDPRNTDNAWMETVAVNYHDEHGDKVGALDLKAGDDAVGVQWTDVSSDLKLYASHYDLLQRVAALREAHW